MKTIKTIYGENVFNDRVMKERLPKNVYQSLRNTILTGEDLDKDIADTVANAMKDWSVEKGATHFAHWFQPMTGTTAAKHESFLAPQSDQSAIFDFSGKNLIKGEPDASSFPSGGLRDTFEARGYTSWDPTSPAFVQGETLFIPSVFYSYTGNVLDKKVPLLRSEKLVSEAGLRIMRLFGDQTIKTVRPTMGVEQEYFLIDKAVYDQRKDLVICGRTLFGAPAPKGQEFGDHYFSVIDERVDAFMSDLDWTLWSLGVPSKVKHSEVAPRQFEVVPIYNSTNVANDQNQLLMASLRSLAPKHGLACLLHEKPFYGVNGSGKHINWSLGTDTGINLFVPGETAEENARFLLFICAMIHAVDEYPELMRLVVGSAGNDHRLGGHEAPPAILSIFLGEELFAILEGIERGGHYENVDKGFMELGVNTLPSLPKDISDRNRTSPFAYTGDKFEFRMCGSKASVAGPVIALNTAMAQVLNAYADELEGEEDFFKALSKLLAKEIKNHKRIIFNGNNYAKEWEEEAQKRGLPNLSVSVDAFRLYNSQKNIDLFVNNGIYTKEEVNSRMEIHLMDYSRTINIEARTMLEMTHKTIIPAVVNYSEDLLRTLSKKRKFADLKLNTYTEEKLLETISSLLGALYQSVETLEKNLERAYGTPSPLERAESYYHGVASEMVTMRQLLDQLEVHIPEDLWEIPSYTKLLLEY